MKMIKIKTAAEFRREVSALLSKKTTEILTENYTRDGPIQHFRNQYQGRISSSVYARLEYLLKKGYRIEDLETMIKAAKDEKKSIVEWTKSESERLWPEWKKIKKEAENERRRERRENLSAA